VGQISAGARVIEGDRTDILCFSDCVYIFIGRSYKQVTSSGAKEWQTRVLDTLIEAMWKKSAQTGSPGNSLKYLGKPTVTGI